MLFLGSTVHGLDRTQVCRKHLGKDIVSAANNGAFCTDIVE